MDRIGAGYIKSFWQIRIFFMILLRRKLPVLTGLDLWSMVMKMFRIENISIVKCCILDNFAWSEISATLSWLNCEVTWKKEMGKKLNRKYEWGPFQFGNQHIFLLIYFEFLLPFCKIKHTDFSCLIYFEFFFLQLGPGSFRPGQQLRRGEQDREPVEQRPLKIYLYNTDHLNL